MRVSPEPAFRKALRTLPPDRAEGAIAALERFIVDSSRAGLDFRALRRRAGHYIINARHGDRIILRKDGDDLFAAVDVGPHDNIYRRWNRRG